jgi:hypothetical protein
MSRNHDAAGLLARAQARLTPDTWVKDISLGMAAGERIVEWDGFDGPAVRHCGLGAVQLEASTSAAPAEVEQTAEIALHTVAERLGFENFADFNDAAATTLTDVRGAFEQARADLEGAARDKTEATP